MRPEEVLVVPRSSLFSRPSEVVSGFVRGDGEPYLSRVEGAGEFVARGAAEEDPSRKQIIPYGILFHASSVFLMRRSRHGGEARLHRKCSLGVGGHVNPPDVPEGARGGAGLRQAVLRAFERELGEEIVLESAFRARVLGVLNDDSNPVGSVHFGIVYALELAEPRARVREEELLEGRFVLPPELPAYRDAMETWSQILLDELWGP